MRRGSGLFVNTLGTARFFLARPNSCWWPPEWLHVMQEGTPGTLGHCPAKTPRWNDWGISIEGSSRKVIFHREVLKGRHCHTNILEQSSQKHGLLVLEGQGKVDFFSCSSNSGVCFSQEGFCDPVGKPWSGGKGAKTDYLPDSLIQSCVTLD